MALHLVSEPQYRIDRPGYEGKVFTASSPNRLSTPDAVAFTSQKPGFVLQSVPDAANFRLEADGVDNADKYQKTRSVVAFFTRSGTPWVAIDHVAEENIVVANAQRGYDLNRAVVNELLIGMNDKRLKALLSRAEHEGSIVSLPEGNLELALKEYGDNPLVQALLGDAGTARDYASFLQGKNFNTGYVWLPGRNYVGNTVSDNKNAIIRLVGLGGDGFDGINDVYASDDFGSNGFARGVRSQAPNSP